MWSIFLVVLVMALGAVGYLAVRRWQETSDGAAIRPSGIPASVPTDIADLMELSPVPNQPAPDFTLVDQKGKTLSLSGFRGRSVVLEFMDPHCTDICPIVSQEFVDAFRDLGPNATKTVFMAVNVNAFHGSVAEMAAYSKEQGLNAIPNWHFFTGPNASLRKVWGDYGVYVDAPNPNADVIHTSIVFFIGPQGRERFTAVPMDDHTKSGNAFLPAASLTSWGRGIALVMSHLS